MTATLIPEPTTTQRIELDSVLILDPSLVKDLLDQREAWGLNRFDEVWDGRLVVPPMANNEHFLVTMRLTAMISAVIDWDRGDTVVQGGNLSDRTDWKTNYRVPDALVILAAGGCQDRETHWFGGPDMVLEVLSPGEKKYEKFDFYAAIGTREVLIVERYDWALDLFRLVNGKLVSAGVSTVENPQWITSQSLPLTFRLLPGKSRPLIEAVHTDDGRRWTI